MRLGRITAFCPARVVLQPPCGRVRLRVCWQQLRSSVGSNTMKIINGKLVPDDAAAPLAPAPPAKAKGAKGAKSPGVQKRDGQTEVETAACIAASKEALAAEAPSVEQLRAMLGHAAEEKELNVVCRMDEYEELLRAKVEMVRGLYAASTLALPEIVAHTSPKCFFRQRAEFRTWHTGVFGQPGYKMFYSMFPKSEPRRPVEIPGFPMGARRVNVLMDELRTQIMQSDMLRHKLYEARFLTTLTGDALITMIYHKPIDERWAKAAEPLAKSLGVSLIGRSRKVRLVVGRDYVVERLAVLGEEFAYRQTEGSFSQPNAMVCQKMLTFACEATKGSKDEDLLELYCGNGNFTAPLSRNFRRVLATEIAKPSVELARLNMAANQCHNVTVDKMDSEDFSKAFSGAKEMRLGAAVPGVGSRPTLAHFDRLQTLFVDPPRAGMDAVTCSVASTFRRIVYISCNPETMVRDLQMIVDQLPVGVVTIEKFAVFDQFPYTHHLECGAIVKIAQPNPRAAVPTPQSTSASESCAGAAASLACSKCATVFDSRNELFRHLDESGHSSGGGKGAAGSDLAYVESHHSAWVAWLETEGLNGKGNDPSRHGAEIHARFRKAAADLASSEAADGPAIKKAKVDV
jgi:tRNA (uracil-5-)-methyltransferase